MTNQSQHIVILPFMAHSHVRPFLELAIRIHDRTNFTITILTTPLNADSLRQKLPNSATRIRILILPFDPSSYGLSRGLENTDKISNPATRISFLKTTASLEPQFRSFLSQLDHNHGPLCIIFDYLMGWAAVVARSFGISSVCFSTCGAYGTAAMFSFWEHLPHCGLSDEQPFSLPGFPVSQRFYPMQLSSLHRLANGSDEVSKYLQPLFRLSMEYSYGFLCNSVEEFEPLGFEIFHNYIKKPIWAIGPVISSRSDTNTFNNPQECIQWLNKQKPESVLYVSFGSQSTIPSTDMMELAAGLELSGKSFLWVIRPPSGFKFGEDIRPEWLPDGFEERIKQKGQGILVRQWCPQVEILKHTSTGGFLSHCGWNSVLESLVEGVPIIGWPLGAEQVYNVRMLKEDVGVAVQIEGKVCKEEVKRVVVLVLDREDGSFGWEMKKKAVEMKSKLRDTLKEEEVCKGSSVQAMFHFLDAIVSKQSI